MLLLFILSAICDGTGKKCTANERQKKINDCSDCKLRKRESVQPFRHWNQNHFVDNWHSFVWSDRLQNDSIKAIGNKIQ